MIKNCLFCKRLFEIRQTSKFCSHRCAGLWQKSTNPNIGQGQPVTKIKKICLFCKKQFEVLPCFSSHKFCSGKCHNDSQRVPLEKMKSKRQYRHRCKFKFNVCDYPRVFDLSLLEQHGWYVPTNCKTKPSNLSGVSKDHLLSIDDGFEKKVDPAIMSHPANCDLVLHTDNDSKSNKSSIKIEELLDRINNWHIFIL